jgi:hypothetical protein
MRRFQPLSLPRHTEGSLLCVRGQTDGCTTGGNSFLSLYPGGGLCAEGRFQPKPEIRSTAAVCQFRTRAPDAKTDAGLWSAPLD